MYGTVIIFVKNPPLLFNYSLFLKFMITHKKVSCHFGSYLVTLFRNVNLNTGQASLKAKLTYIDDAAHQHIKRRDLGAAIYFSKKLMK